PGRASPAVRSSSRATAAPRASSATRPTRSSSYARRSPCPIATIALPASGSDLAGALAPSRRAPFDHAEGAALPQWPGARRLLSGMGVPVHRRMAHAIARRIAAVAVTIRRKRNARGASTGHELVPLLAERIRMGAAIVAFAVPLFAVGDLLF